MICFTVGIRLLRSPFHSRCIALLLSASLLAGQPGASAEEHCLICRQRHAADHTLSTGWGIDLEGPGLRYAPDRHFDVKHIRLNVTPDFQRHTVRGITSITVEPIAKPQSQLRLNGIDLTVHRVWSDDIEVADFVVSPLDVVVQFREAIPVGKEITLHLDHEAQPERGFYFRTPDMGYPKSDTHVWTQGEAHEARYWFPCFDYPNERSTTEVICHVPADMAVLSNGRLVSESVDSETGLKTAHWLQDKPHVNYLICLVAGYFEKLGDQHRDVPLGFYAQPSLAQHAANSFQDTAQIMAFFEEEIGMPYPWDKYDQVTILDFVAGGMENTTLTTLTHNTIFSSETENLRSTRSLDAHELAHQWFGDYVTCKDWSHLWLNEGFATYLAHLYEGHKFGRDAMLYGLYQDARRSILPQANDKRPIVYRGYRNAGEQFDYRVYPKGSWVLHMLRSQLGEDLFRQGVKTYLERHALQSVVTEDLRKVFEEMSGLPLDRFFDQWLYHARFPDLTIDYKWLPEEKLARVEVKQTHQVDDDVLLFAFPTKLRFVFDEGESIETPVQIERPVHEFFVPMDKQPDLVRFDPDLTVLANVQFRKTDAMLMKQMEQSSDMIGRLLAVEALGERKTAAAIERLGQALREDSFFGVRVRSAESLAKIGTEAALKQLVTSVQQQDARVRREVVRGIAGFYRPEAREKLEEILASESNPMIRGDVLQGLAKFQQPETRRHIVAGLRDVSFRSEELDAAVSAISAQNDPSYQRALTRMLETRGAELSSDSLGKSLVALATIGRFAPNKGHARELITSYVHDPRRRVQTSALSALGKLGDPLSAPLLRSYAEQQAGEAVSQAARSALSALEEQKPLTPAEVSELRQLVRDLQEGQRQLSDKLKQFEEKSQPSFNP